MFRKPTLEQITGFIAPTWQALIDGAKYVDPRLMEIIDELQPDAIVEDNVVAFPALPASGRPWVRIASCNPAEIKDPLCRAILVAAIRPATGPHGRRSLRVPPAHADIWSDFDAFMRAAGAPRPDGLAAGSGVHPRVAVAEPVRLSRGGRLQRATARAARGIGSDSSVRATDGDVVAAGAPCAAGRGSSIYLSLGSLGSADVELMQRLVDILGRSPHRVIVSKGPLADQIRLHENMTGEEFLPQPAILPQVDLVITHGGNNTVTECFHNGKPMIVLPLFWDQVDNAQRVHEAGFGQRFGAYSRRRGGAAGRGRPSAGRYVPPPADGDHRRAPPGEPGHRSRRRPHRARRGDGRARPSRGRAGLSHGSAAGLVLVAQSGRRSGSSSGSSRPAS